MRVATVEYSANQPTPQQIIVPTNSKYAVGVKVYKDGAAVDCSLDEIKVDGLSAVSQRAGYNVYELSSGGNPSIDTLAIVAEKKSSVDYSAAGTATWSGAPIIPAIPIRPEMDILPLSATDLSGITTINAADMAEYELTATLSTADGTTAYSLLPLIWADASDINTKWQIEDGAFKNITNPAIVSNAITVAPNGKFFATSMSQLNKAGAITCDYNIKVDSNDGFDGRFALQVMQRDLGYIEI